MFGHGASGDERVVILRDVAPRSTAIPQWMTQPAAAALGVHSPPRLSRGCLLGLRITLDVILSSEGDPSDVVAPAGVPGSIACTTAPDSTMRIEEASAVGRSVRKAKMP